MTLPQASLFIVSFREKEKKRIQRELSNLANMPSNMPPNMPSNITFPVESTEEDRYKGVTIDSSKFGSEITTREKFEEILNEVILN